MDIRDATIGKVVLASTTGLFLILVVWVNTYPFLDEDTLIYSYVPDPQWFLLACAVWGLCFIGGLMSFTLYHIYPYLLVNK